MDERRREQGRRQTSRQPRADGRSASPRKKRRRRRSGAAWALLYVVFVIGISALLFFSSDAARIFGRVRHRTSRQTINFKKAAKEAKKDKGYLHKCAVCGITDAEDPNMEFRYCSKCSGYYCYCMAHINNHVHIP